MERSSRILRYLRTTEHSAQAKLRVAEAPPTLVLGRHTLSLRRRTLSLRWDDEVGHSGPHIRDERSKHTSCDCVVSMLKWIVLSCR